MFRTGEVLDDRVLRGGDPGGEGAEQLVCRLFNNLTYDTVALSADDVQDVGGAG